VSAIDAEADRLTRLVEEILDMSRIEAGSLHPRLELYAADEVVSATLPQLEAGCSRSRIGRRRPPSISRREVDIALIGRVLSNLLENAFKYAPPGSTVRLSAVRRLAGCCLVSPMTGQAFHRRYGSAYRRVLPDGAPARGADVRGWPGPIDSAEGSSRHTTGGFAWRVRHRRRIGGVLASVCRGEPRWRRIGRDARCLFRRTAFRGGTMTPRTRILVVDDDTQMLRSVKAGLSARDYDIVTAQDGASALVMAAEAAPQLIVLDLGLPDIDGVGGLQAPARVDQPPYHRAVGTRA